MKCHRDIAVDAWFEAYEASIKANEAYVIARRTSIFPEPEYRAMCVALTAYTAAIDNLYETLKPKPPKPRVRK